MHLLIELLHSLQALAQLAGRKPRIAGVLDDLGREQDQELGPVMLVVRRLEEIAEDRDVGEDGNAGDGILRVILDQSAEIRGALYVWENPCPLWCTSC